MPKFNKVLPVRLACSIDNLSVREVFERAMESSVCGVWLAILVNRVEHGIRVFDPCLSCSTHAVGKMPLLIEVVASDGSLVRKIARD